MCTLSGAMACGRAMFFMVTYCGFLRLGLDVMAIAAKPYVYWASHSVLHKKPFRLPRW